MLIGLTRGIPGEHLGGLWPSTDAIEARPLVDVYPADRTCLGLLGISLVRGRLYSDEEAKANAPIAVVDERAADLLWPGQEALGQSVRDEQSPQISSRTVIGVIRTVNWMAPAIGGTRGTAFLPLDPAGRSPDTLVFRGAVTPELVETARQIAREIEPQGETRATPLTIGERVMAQPRLLATLFGALSALAILLTVAGVYAIVSYGVARRGGEIGIRMALGTTTTGVRRLVIGEALRPAAVGVCLGLGLSVWWSGTLRSVLFELQPHDPVTYALTGVGVLAVVVLASAVPARRASLVDPAAALRMD
jgi:putative ABC transport system permease protein